MTVFLFNEIIFGPVSSRRLGLSLGVNLLPLHKKYCNFNCVYCECGWTGDNKSVILPSKKEVLSSLEKYLQEIAINKKPKPDVITFAGNGEPTMHPDFPDIIDETINLKNQFFPEIKIAVLTNATNLDKSAITTALKKIDLPILKLDTFIESDFYRINNPINKNINVKVIVDNICNHFEKPIIQTMFFKAQFDDGYIFDNTNEISLNEYLKALKRISPSLVMIYSVARDTPMQNIFKIDIDKLNEISKKIESIGFKTLVTP